MKNLIVALITTFAFTAFAHEIEGTLILKGSLKTKIVVNTLQTTCRVKIDKVRNLMEEDSFGNPGYLVKTEIRLDGEDFERGLKVKFKEEIMFKNLFALGNRTEIRDLEYASSSGASLLIDKEGRIKSVTFPSQYNNITCRF